MAASTAKTAELAAALLKDDPEIRKELKGLFRDIIKHQRLIMLTGSPQERSSLVKAILPQMLQAMGTAAAEEEQQQEQAAYERILALCRGEVTASEVPQTLRGLPAAS